MQTAPHSFDLQCEPPQVALALDSVGVVGLQRMVVWPSGQPVQLRFEADVELSAQYNGAHMSRFSEAVSECVDAIPNGARLGDMAAELCSELALRQRSPGASVRIDARLHREQSTPVSERSIVQPILLHAHARLHDGTMRRALGATVTGINACPCAQGLVRESSAERLLAAGYDTAQIEEILAAVPLATHNQRATGTLTIGSATPPDWEQLASIVQRSMSAPIHELLKRTDELRVVEDAHNHPKFVEDSVRQMLSLSLAELALDEHDVICARQVNFETIHTHEVVARRTAQVGELTSELSGGEPSSTPLQSWLDGGR